MVRGDDAKNVATVQNAGFVDLGVIKEHGDQNYTLGSDLDLAKFAQCRYGANDQREFRSCGAKNRQRRRKITRNDSKR